MIDAFYIFTKGGLLLWSTQLVKIKGNPIDGLIKEVLLEERVGETSAKVDSYSLKWKLLNEMDTFFVVVYQGILQMAYLESLLAMATKEFFKQFSDSFGNGLTLKRVDFDATFLEVRKKADREQMEARKPKGMKSFGETKKGQEVLKSREEKGLPTHEAKSKGGGGGGGDEEDDDGGEGGEEDSAAAAREAARAKLKARAQRGSVKAAAKEKEEPPSAMTEEKSKKGKERRHWDGEGRVSSKAMQELDFSKAKPRPENGGSGDDDDAALMKQKATFLGDSADEEEWQKEAEDVESLSSGDEDEEEKPEKEETGRVGGLFKTLTRSVKNLTGGATLTDEDLDPILASFRTALMSKNVAADVATKLSDSVRQSLVGRKTERFSSMTATVKQALKDSMENLLTPKKSIDVLRAALAAKNAGRVYTIVFLGVNGVGKSTNLAKVAYYLKHKGGLDVLICACDTFRAGAVEQLKTHSRCLDVPLFERGYGKDPAEIAKASIQHAKNHGHDVVLVDTAGRMQDNEPLMRALAKLVAVNSPDLVLFVGEALVGNDAIDQVTKFNRSLVDMSHDPSKPRGIDGMLLTKYDTVDDKVGAALSMVYVTGQPIVFVGTGQKYTHLRKMQAKEVVKTLLG